VRGGKGRAVGGVDIGVSRSGEGGGRGGAGGGGGGEEDGKDSQGYAGDRELEGGKKSKKSGGAQVQAQSMQVALLQIDRFTTSLRVYYELTNFCGTLGAGSKTADRRRQWGETVFH
jgi:hypothetical protein